MKVKVNVDLAVCLEGGFWQEERVQVELAEGIAPDTVNPWDLVQAAEKKLMQTEEHRHGWVAVGLLLYEEADEDDLGQDADGNNRCTTWPDDDDDQHPECSECDNTMDIESTYCGSFCPSCLAEHLKSCQVCANDLPARRDWQALVGFASIGEGH